MRDIQERISQFPPSATRVTGRQAELKKSLTSAVKARRRAGLLARELVGMSSLFNELGLMVLDIRGASGPVDLAEISEETERLSYQSPDPVAVAAFNRERRKIANAPQHVEARLRKLGARCSALKEELDAAEREAGRELKRFSSLLMAETQSFDEQQWICRKLIAWAMQRGEERLTKILDE